MIDLICRILPPFSIQGATTHTQRLHQLKCSSWKISQPNKSQQIWCDGKQLESTMLPRFIRSQVKEHASQKPCSISGFLTEKGKKEKRRKIKAISNWQNKIDIKRCKKKWKNTHFHPPIGKQWRKTISANISNPSNMRNSIYWTASISPSE